MKRVTRHTAADLKTWRLDHKFTQSEAADYLRISQPLYCKLERGSVGTTQEIAQRILEKTGAQVLVIVGVA